MIMLNLNFFSSERTNVCIILYIIYKIVLNRSLILSRYNVSMRTQINNYTMVVFFRFDISC